MAGGVHYCVDFDALAYALETMTGTEIERLFDRMPPARVERVIEIIAFETQHEIENLRALADEHDAVVAGLRDEIDDLKEEVSELKSDLTSIECDRDFLQGRIHCLTGETFDE